ncbi:phosphoinositide 3-kinase regulatory subunit 5-like [Salvelinus sp. IW2-2015]|uniref:phosphoinositide 3-kinase regulatory subunit 5-like n=1 Tax=Salvelinus sp. IW2-2015 TaxID=2691554 RepID=UPI000CEAA7EB|nr:phosphoinositide 3-kinase regulatory subunit 5-like [Salvelinus alpinus]
MGPRHSQSLLQSLKGLVESIGIPPPDCHTGPGNVHTLPVAKYHMYSWDKVNFDILNDLQSELDQLPVFNLSRDKGEEDEETGRDKEPINRPPDLHCVHLLQRLYVLQLLPVLHLVCALNPV